MKLRFHFDSIAARLTWMTLLVSGIALLLAGASFVAYDQITFRESLIRNLSAQAEIVGDNSVSAVTFNDPDVAGRTLSALRNTQNVRAAAIVTPDGRAFAEYRNGAERVSDFPPVTSGTYEQWWKRGGEILVARRIVFQGKHVATVYILADLRQVSARLWRYGLIALMVLAVSLLAALVATRFFRRSISGPVERLAATAREVSRDKNFALRGDVASSTHELRVLVGSFNEMLSAIQERDAALQKMAAESLATLQSIPQLVWTSGPGGETEFLNQRWFDYTGMATDASRDDLYSYIHSEDRPAVRQAWEASVRSGAEFRMEHRVCRNDGVFRWHLAQALPIRDDGGRVQKWFGTLTDIHDRKLAETALVQAEKLAATGRMAATIAHEINNPLASITNLAHLLKSMEQPSDQQLELLSLLDEEVARVSHIVKSTLGLSRQTSTPSAVDIAELVESAFSLFQRRFYSRGIQVVKLYDSAGFVTVVPSEVRQVVSNLLGNALDVVPVGGRLTVAVRSSFDWSEPGRRGVRITVMDSGPGVAPQARHRLFEPFFTTKAEMGTGLGLWVSKTIVEKHGGSIRFRSRHAGAVTGTCFSVFLPFDSALSSRSQVA